MQSANDDEIKARQAQGLNLHQSGMRLAAVLGATILYILIFQLIAEKVGLVTAAFIYVPVALAGLFFGVNAGLVASLMGIALNALLLSLFDGSDWLGWITGYWPGNLMVIVIGYFAGRLHKGLAERASIKSELRSHDRYLALINLTTKNILDPKEPEYRYYYLVNHLANLFVADSAYLVRWDAPQEQAFLVASTMSLEQSFSHLVSDPGASGIIASVIQTGRALVMNDVSRLRNFISSTRPNVFSPLIQSVLVIPLNAGAYKFGAGIVAFEFPRSFTSEDLQYAAMIGNQIGLAFWAVQQELKIQKRLREANALANIERVLSETERVGIDTVLQFIVDSAKELIPGTERAVLHFAG
jgi:GAF domain-containing protein